MKVWIPIHRTLAAVLAGIRAARSTSQPARTARPGRRTASERHWGRLLERLTLPKRLVFHGLRKSAVVMLLEAGCTTAEVAAITGQSFDMVEHYESR